VRRGIFGALAKGVKADVPRTAGASPQGREGRPSGDALQRAAENEARGIRVTPATPVPDGPGERTDGGRVMHHSGRVSGACAGVRFRRSLAADPAGVGDHQLARRAGAAAVTEGDGAVASRRAAVGVEPQGRAAGTAADHDVLEAGFDAVHALAGLERPIGVEVAEHEPAVAPVAVLAAARFRRARAGNHRSAGADGRVARQRQLAVQGVQGGAHALPGAEVLEGRHADDQQDRGDGQRDHHFQHGKARAGGRLPVTQPFGLGRPVSLWMSDRHDPKVPDSDRSP
jgi:hypothetical protein